ncbi:unnamed protein product [Closterium sp. NIES-53]
MLALCREQRLEHRTKHIALRYFLARELQQRGQLRLAYVASEANTADVFTKALAPCDHQRCCTQLGLLCFALLCLTGLVTPCSPPLCLWGTSGMGLVLGGRSPVVLTGHVDASWADDQATQRSSQGYTFGLGSGSVSWRATRSSSVLGSSCEAEIYAGAMAAQELRWLTYLLTDLGEPPRSPPVLYVDNKAMLALCREQRLEHRTKHIALRYFLARELQQRGQLRLAYVASEANTADVFTRALAPCDHQRCCTQLVHLHLHERFHTDLPVLRLHSDKGGEFSSDLLRDCCRGEGILQSFTLPDSPQQNGIAERRIGLVMEVAHTSMIHAAAFFVAVCGPVGDASVFRVWGSRAFVRDTSADKLSACAIPCVFLGFSPDAPGWQFYHPTSRRVFPSQDVMFEESVPFYRLFPYRSAPPPPPQLFLTPDPLPRIAPVEVAVGSGAASGGATSVDAEPGGAESEGAGSGGVEPGGAEPGGAGAVDPGAGGAGGTSTTASALVAELDDFAAACHLDYVTALVAESVSASPPSVGGECALGTDVLEDRQEDFECLVAAVPRFASMLFAPEGDLDAPDIPTPRSYAEAITGPYSSQWQAAMDAEMASWKSTGTYVDAGVDYFQTFSPTPKMTTLRVLLHVPAQRDYEMHSLDFMGELLNRLRQAAGDRCGAAVDKGARQLQLTGLGDGWAVDQEGLFNREVDEVVRRADNRRRMYNGASRANRLRASASVRTAVFYGAMLDNHSAAALAHRRPAVLVGRLSAVLHKEIWLRRPLGFTGSFPACIQWSLRRPLYGLHQAPREWHDTLSTTLAALGLAPSTVDPSLFLRTDTLLPPFYVLMCVDDLVFATTDTEALTLVKSELQKRHTCTDLDELRSYLGFQITRDIARRTITMTQSHMVQQSVEPSGPYPELVGCLMYLMTCTRPDFAYPLSLQARYVAPVRWAWGSCLEDGVQSSSQVTQTLLGSSCEAEIYVGAMAAQELCWLTYLLTDLGEQPRSPPVMYIDNNVMIVLCQEHRLEHRMKHIAMRYFLARELQQRGQLRLAYVATRANTADIFTKALPPGDHQRFSTVLGLLALLFLTGLTHMSVCTRSCLLFDLVDSRRMARVAGVTNIEFCHAGPMVLQIDGAPSQVKVKEGGEPLWVTPGCRS